MRAVTPILTFPRRGALHKKAPLNKYLRFCTNNQLGHVLLRRQAKPISLYVPTSVVYKTPTWKT